MIGFPEDGRENTVRRLAKRGASSTADCGAVELTIGSKLGHQLDNQSRLATSTLPHDADKLRTTALHALEGSEQLIELVVASNHSSHQPVRRESARRLWLVQLPDQTMYDHRLRLAPQP